MKPLVLDTNIVLDLFVFRDEQSRPLLGALEAGHRWLATAAMREELLRVLGYPKIGRRLLASGGNAHEVMAAFDRHASLVEPPHRAPVTCGDPDDQKFIDLAIGAGALLLSKDAHVLAMRRRVERLGATVARSHVAS